VATISFISPQAEYTPPVIYSESIRAKLVYMVEARPSPQVAATINPGQPIAVRPGKLVQAAR
jgi:HlyD family secretion protein